MKITKIITIFSIFALSVVGVSALASRADAESQLIRQSRELLRANGWGDKVEVHFNGHQCILKGEIETTPEKLQIEQLVSALEGVYGLDTGGLQVSSR
ncbi:MAG: hypothetical protein KDN22_01145 [Verrucomicrobiae bacterium]|nr:hypothetical protein [Verrucomicrobiae bacterium]